MTAPPVLSPTIATIAVLGACRGIGSQICLRLALEGIRVIGVGWDAIALQHLQHEIEDIRGHFHPVLIEQHYPELPSPLPILDRMPSLTAIIDCTACPSLRVLQHIASEEYRQAIAQTRPNGAIALIDLWCRALSPDVLPQIIQILSFQRHLSALSPDLGDAADILAPTPWPRPHLSPEAESPIHLVYLEMVQSSAGDQPSLEWIDTPSPLIPPVWIWETVWALLAGKGGDRLIRVTSEQGYRIAPSSANQTGTTAPSVTPLGEPLPVVVKQTAVGRGVFARRQFAPGERVLRTTGKAIAHQTEHSIQIGWNQHVEPDAPIRWINHSCEPNLGVQTNEWGLPDFVAFRAIAPNDELTFDYAMTEWIHQPRDSAALEFELTCRCGTATCRGRLGYYSELPDALKHTYQGFISNYLVHSPGITLLGRR